MFLIVSIQNIKYLKWKLLFLFIYSFFIYNFSSAQVPPIGQWREHLQWRNGKAVTASDENIYCAALYGVYSVSKKDLEITRYSKVSGLNDIGVKTIRYDNADEKLLIAYNNSNLDILYRNDIINIPDIKRKNINGDKSVYNIFFYDHKAWLSTGLGIIIVNLDKYEIADTYPVGNNGNNVRVNGITIFGNIVYAATAEGLKSASLSASNLTDYKNWNLVSGTNGLAEGSCDDVISLQDKIVVSKNDSLFYSNGTTWNYFYSSGWHFENINESEGKILVCEEQNNFSERRVVVLNATGTAEKIIQDDNRIMQPLQAINNGNEVWIADLGKGLIRNIGSSFDDFFINSPYGALDGDLLFNDGTLWVAGGSVNAAWNYQYNPTGFFSFRDNYWQDYNIYNVPLLDSVLDVITLAVDIKTGILYAGSFGGGLVEYDPDNTYKLYKQNSPIGPAIGDPTSYRISGLAVDEEGNLWISNYAAADNLLVKKADGSWSSFKVPFMISENAVAQIVIDDYDQKWIVSPKDNGLICFNDGGSIDNTGDDNWKYYRLGPGNGNLPSNNVYCITKDKDGYIWVGTDRGIGVIQCPQETFSGNGCEAILPVVQQDQFAGYLFGSEEVNDIAVDGANRKWVATKNGVWLISADGEKTIYRFTEENSPLLSNEVFKIAIDQQTGEVYFMTFNGICSFRSTATEGTSSNQNVLVFPNPVPPGFSGTIAIRGVADNAIVKITEPDGRLVFQTRALGGQAVWDVKDYRGRKVNTGVYLVLIADDTNTEKAVTKIVFIN